MNFLRTKKVWLSLLLTVILVVGGFGIYYFSLTTSSSVVSAATFNYHQNAKVAEDSALTLTFPVAMDPVSVEMHLITPEKFSATKTWSADQKSLTLVPAKPLSLGEVFTFFLERSALRADGKILGREINYAFEIAGAPRVVSRLPAPDALDLPAATKIVLTFDRPMVPLQQIQGVTAENEFENLIKITPTIPGRWRWLGTTTLEFQPTDKFQLATKYSINVPRGLHSLLGDTTTEDFSWNFTTLRPAVTDFTPNESGVKPSSPITLNFNQPINLASVQNHFTLTKINNTDKQKIAIMKLAYGTQKDATEHEVVDQTKVIVTSSALTLHTQYHVQLSPGVRGLVGDLPTELETDFSFATAGELSVTEARGHDAGLALTFSNAVSDQTLLENFQIQPTPEKWKLATALRERFTSENSADDQYEPANNFTSSLELALPLAPRMKYVITLGTNLTDEFGQKLARPYRYEFTTAPVPSKATLYNKKGEFGIFEKNKAPIYYANAVNVSRLDFRLARLTLPQFLALRERKQNDWSATPELATTNDNFYRELSVTPPKNIPDTWEALPLDLAQKFGGQLTAGIYVLALSAPEYFDEQTEWNEKLQKEIVVAKTPHIEYQYFALTNLGITLKYSGTRTLVWVTDLTTGASVDSARIQFHTLGGETPLSGTTDKAGIFTANLDLKKFVTNGNTWQPEFWVTAETSADFAFVANDWNNGIQPWNLGLPSDFRGADARPFRADSYVYTERPLYSAGDTVYFKGLLRFRDKDGKLLLPQNSKQIDVTINDAVGSEVHHATLPLTEFGSFAGEFPLAKSATLGSYYLSASVLPDDDVDAYLSTNFSVLAYRKPEYRVSAEAEREEYVEGAKMEVKVNGNYYFGAPLADAIVAWRLKTTDYFFNKYAGDEWYNFGVDEWCFTNCERASEIFASGKSYLDAKGELSITTPLQFPEQKVSQVATLEVDVTDPNNQTLSTSASVIVHKTDVYVGIRTEDYVVSPGQKARVKFITLNPDGTPRVNTSVTVKLFARKWNTVKKKNVDGEYYFDNTLTDTFLRENIVTTDQAGKGATELLIERGGEFQIIAEVTDSASRIARAGTSVYAFSDTYINFPHENDDSIPVLTDKPEYKVGDTAKLLVKSPFQGKGVKALVTVERENILTKQIIDITSNAQPIEIKITDDLIPTAYVSVVVLKPRLGETFDENGVDTGVPAFKLGYATLHVETSSKKLALSIQTDKPKYGPREKVNVKIKALDASGRPVRAELSFGAVDLSLLALTGFSLPDVVNYFYSERGLGVMTSQSLIYLMERFKPGSKGGGGGDPEARARGLFRDTAYWNPHVLTDANGEANLSFTLPDNLTTWQLLAIANTKNNLFGAVVKEIVETKKVIVRSVRPRFAVARDEIQIGAIVHNYLDTDSEFSVTLAGTGFTLSDSATQKVFVKTGASEKVIFPLVVSLTDKLTFNFKAVAPNGADEVSESIPVYRFGVPQSVATNGVVTNTRARVPTASGDSVLEKVFIPSESEALEGKITATLSPTIASYLPGGLAYVTNYPYGCAEQIISSFLPNVAVKALQNFSAFKIVSDEKLATNVSVGLQKLYQLQRADGGFGYWTESRESVPYLTAYVVYGLNRARDAGYAVDADALARAQNYLLEVLRRPHSNTSLALDLTTRAHILFVLAETGVAPISLVNNLYDQRKDLALFAKAELAMTLQKIDAPERAQGVLKEVLNFARVDPRGVHFAEAGQNPYGALMNTNAHTTAIVALALTRIDSQNVLLPNVMRYLLAIREDGHWDTTQSTSAAIFALVEYLNMTAELDGKFTASIAIGTQKFEQKFNAENILTKKEVTVAFTDLLRDDENTLVITKQGSGRLYYELLLSYFYTAESLPPVEAGIGLTRELFALDATTPLTTNEVKLNDTYKVKLKITVPEERNFVAVESPLPAGMEAVDFNLQTVSQDLREKIMDNSSSEKFWESGAWRFSHVEMRDDRVVLFADYLPAGTYEYEYLIRATTPGRFQLRPARAFEMYFPEVFGQTEGGWFLVLSS